ncbi:hypothetical protein RRG08_047431 [Elysia crispata]|uniref:Uncharacterized protein n=1 Tax=Elysia crispata TaxID=231223 RepID=A0AAE0YUP2_9GAST|nr:hypothetical protein RRG08_047431 [Elysia crispata]
MRRTCQLAGSTSGTRSEAYPVKHVSQSDLRDCSLFDPRLRTHFPKRKYLSCAGNYGGERLEKKRGVTDCLVMIMPVITMDAFWADYLSAPRRQRRLSISPDNVQQVFKDTAISHQH